MEVGRWLSTVPENVQRERPSAATTVLEIADNGVTIWTATNLQRTVRNMWRMRYERDSFPWEAD